MNPGSIPEPQGDYGDQSVVPATAALLPQDVEGPELRAYNISFAQYDRKDCQIDGMDPDNAKGALIILRDVGVHFTSKENFLGKTKSNVEIKNVARDGEYASLYKGLVDEEIREIKYRNDNKDVDIRVFYYTLESEKIFYLVATRHTHLDISKSKNKHNKKSGGLRPMHRFKPRY